LKGAVIVQKRIMLVLGLFSAFLFATESRIESMGKRDLFFRDDMSIFYNPANVGVLGNFITGSLGFVSDVLDTSVVTRIRGGIEVKDTVVDVSTATPTNQWFGVVYGHKVNDKVSALFGAAFNRTDDYLVFYDSVRSQKVYKTGNSMPELKGKSDYMVGAKIGLANVGVSMYSASQHFIEGSEGDQIDVNVSLKKISVGSEIGIGSHSLEIYGSAGFLTYSNKNDRSASLDVGETTDNSLWFGGRLFYKTSIGDGVVFVPALSYKSVAGFDSTFTNLTGGMGINLRLDGGFFWAGVVAEYYSSGNDTMEAELDGLGARFNFGIEKSLIWKWFTVRVGGSKFIAKETFTVGNSEEQTRWVENAVDNGTSDDFLGFGIGLNYQNRLRFDITLNEALPYFNPFGDGLKNSSNGGHMLLRISSTFSL
jgi:hypothetical protein